MRNKPLRDEAFLIAFGQRVKDIRKAKGLTQDDLGHKMSMKGVEQSQIKRIEQGTINTSLSHMYAICKALNITPAELFEGLE